MPFFLLEPIWIKTEIGLVFKDDKMGKLTGNSSTVVITGDDITGGSWLHLGSLNDVNMA